MLTHEYINNYNSMIYAVFICNAKVLCYFCYFNTFAVLLKYNLKVRTFILSGLFRHCGVATFALVNLLPPLMTSEIMSNWYINIIMNACVCFKLFSVLSVMSCVTNNQILSVRTCVESLWGAVQTQQVVDHGRLANAPWSQEQNHGLRGDLTICTVCDKDRHKKGRSFSFASCWHFE